MTFAGITERVRCHPYLCTLLLLQAAAFLLFAGTFGNAWTYDDFPVIVNNPDVRSWSNFWQDHLHGRPLRELSFLLDHALFGMQPAGWHLQQIFWHGLNAFLLAALLLRLAQPAGVALLAGGLFLAHPLTVEVVANLSHRKDSLVLAFLLLAVHAWLQVLRSPRRWWWLAAMFLCWGVALLAKENAVVLPALLLALEMFVMQPEERFLARSLRACLATAGVLVAAGIGYFFYAGGMAAFGRAGQYVLSKLNVLGEFSLATYLLVLLKSWLFMWLKLVAPVGLAVEYTYPVPGALFDPWVLAALLLLVALPVLIFLCARKAPLVALGLSWFVLFFAPVANLWPDVYFAADRYLYAPLTGVAMTAAWALWQLRERWRAMATGLAFTVLVLLAVLTWRQARVWVDEAALWHRAVEVSPDSVYALNNLGVIYGRQKDMQRALELITRAAANPYYREAQENMARLHARLGNAEEAKRYQQRAQNPHAAPR